MKSILTIAIFTLIAGLFITFIAGLTIYFYRRSLSGGGWSLAIATGLWVMCLCIIIFLQRALSAHDANILVPTGLGLVTLVFIGVAIFFLRMMGLRPK